MSQTIVFGGGCFWCVEAIFRRLRGVESVLPGYAGGKRENPTYQQVSTGTTEHAEVVQVVFDPAVVSLDTLLSVFFATHDPTTLNRQGNDVGTEYRSTILCTSDEQKNEVNKFIAQLVADQTFSSSITTTVESLVKFYEAEQYHQNYYERNQEQPYCQLVISPKIAKLRAKFSHLLDE